VAADSRAAKARKRGRLKRENIIEGY